MKNKQTNIEYIHCNYSTYTNEVKHLNDQSYKAHLNSRRFLSCKYFMTHLYTFKSNSLINKKVIVD